MIPESRLHFMAIALHPPLNTPHVTETASLACLWLRFSFFLLHKQYGVVEECEFVSQEAKLADSEQPPI